MLETNEYFDGKVKSIAFQAQDKSATVGVMAIGEYKFNTSEKENVTIISGQLKITLKDQSTENTYTAGQSFDVVANSSFSVTATSETAYLCVYG